MFEAKKVPLFNATRGDRYLSHVTKGLFCDISINISYALMTVMTDDSFLNLRGKEILVYYIL